MKITITAVIAGKTTKIAIVSEDKDLQTWLRSSICQVLIAQYQTMTSLLIVES